MADTPDKPTTDTAKPAATRRRAPRKATAQTATGTAKTTVRKAAKRVASKAEHAIDKAGDTAVRAERSVARAVKPRGSSRPKPSANTRRPTTARGGKAGNGHGSGKWSIAAIAGGIAAAGATVAAVLSLRGSGRQPEPTTARTPDVAEAKDVVVVEETAAS